MATLAHNHKVSFDYEILEKYEAGIELSGIEVKSVRAGKISLAGAFISMRGGEAYLLNADVSPYQPENTPDGYDPKRPRRLLLKKAEIVSLADIEAKKGLTIVPISVYSKAGKNSRGSRLKLEIAVVRGKKQHDKRQSTKKRETERELHREYGA
ncbi:SsrA-binding protein SmpB [bacterium]|nr:SsrA-binding protein SmpB [bacterium]